MPDEGAAAKLVQEILQGVTKGIRAYEVGELEDGKSAEQKKVDVALTTSFRIRLEWDEKETRKKLFGKRITKEIHHEVELFGKRDSQEIGEDFVVE